MRNEEVIIESIQSILYPFITNKITFKEAERSSFIASCVFYTYHSIKGFYTCTDINCTHKRKKQKPQDEIYEMTWSIYNNKNEELLRYIIYKPTFTSKFFKINILKKFL